MAGQADGSIIVDTELDSEGFKAGSKELQTAVKSLNKQVGSLGPTFNKALRGNEKAMESFDLKALALEDTIAEIEAKMESLGNQRGPTKEYTALRKEWEAADLTVARLNERMKKMQATGVKENSKAWRALQYDIDLASEKAVRAYDRMRAMEANGTAFTSGVNTGAYRQLSATLEIVRNRLSQMRVEAARANEMTLMQRVLAGIKAAAHGAGSAAKNLLSKTGSLISGFRRLGSFIGSAVSRLNIFNRQSGACTKAVQRLTKKVGGLWNMFKMRMLRTLIMGAFNSLKEGVNNLAQYSTDTNNSLSALKSGLTQLKNSFATAFSPILTAVTPALVSLINHISGALTHVGMLVAALSGAKTFVKATAVQEDYAKSLSATSKAAKDAKRQLASFDDLNILSDSDSSNGTAAIEDMFQTVAIESNISSFVSQLKTALRNQDYGSIGELLGGKINTAIQRARDLIHWDNLGNAITENVTGITGVFNAAIKTVDWPLLGDTVAQGINTIVNTAHLFVATIEWRGIGSSLATGLNGAVSGIDWAKLARTVGDFIKGLLEAIIGFIEDTDWQQIGRSVATFVGNVDWGGLLSALVRGIGAVLGGLAALIWGIILTAWESVVGWWYDVAYEDGAFTMEGLLQGIWDGICNIGAWIRDNIFRPFIDGFCNAFGIHSPSTVMAEYGRFIIQGLLNGIVGAWQGVLTFVSTALDGLGVHISSAWQSVKSKAFEAWTNVKNSITNTLRTAKTEASTALENICSTAKTKSENAKSVLAATWEGIKSSAVSAWSDLRTTVSDTLSGISGDASSTFSSLTANAKTWGADLCSNLSSGIKSSLDTVTTSVKSVASNINSYLHFTEPDVGPLSNFHTYMPDMLDLMAEGIKANQYKAVNAVADVAAAISDEVQGGEYSIGGIGVGSVTGLSRQLTSVAAMMDAANAVANSAAYRAPAVAIGSVAPYEVIARVEGSDNGSTDALLASNDALGVTFTQVIAEAVQAIVAAIEANGGGGGAFDTDNITTAIIREINRRTRVAGQSPLLG